MSNISKSFGEVKAVQNVDFELKSNEILGIVGDNAAGKSTLMKILSGALIPDSGEIYFEGKKAEIKSPIDSRNLGIEMVYQDFTLADNLNIIDNIFIGRELTKNFFGIPIKILNKDIMERESSNLLSKLQINFKSPRLNVANLSGGQKRSVSISRAIYFDAKVLIMDEPTANLGIKEINKLMDLIKLLREKGLSIIIISHRLQDIFTIGDRVIVLRSGSRVGEKKIKDTTMEEVVKLIVGVEA